MSLNIRLKHSATKDKKPLVADLKPGELALNINNASPAGYALDDANVVQQMFGKATETQEGQAEIATQAEVTTGTDDEKIVTPLKLATAVPAATEALAGKAELATQAEVTAGTDDTRIVTPLKLATAVPAASDTIAGKAKLATQTEVTAGTDTTKIVTPATAKATFVDLAGDTMTGDLSIKDASLTTSFNGTTRATITKGGAGLFTDSVQAGGNPAAGGAAGTAIVPTGQLVISRAGLNDAIQVYQIKGGLKFAVKATGEVSANGACYLKGLASHAGVNGGFSTNLYNFNWTGGGGGQLWIDTTRIGQIAMTSDYRTKKDITPMSDGAIDRVKSLKPCTFSRAEFAPLFKNDDTIREGFIAHELQGVIPSAVDGKKDAENEIQSLNLDALVSVLTKALQESVTRIEALEAEVTSFKRGATPRRK